MKIFSIFVIIAVMFAHANSYICNTPDEWWGVEIPGGCGRYNPLFLSPLPRQPITCPGPPYVTRNKLWTDGVVPYKLNDSLTLDDIIEVKKAIEEYHQKTCLRFKPWESGTINFVSIEVDDRICGIADVGLKQKYTTHAGSVVREGYQFARFGGVCRTKATMIHELGHTLGLGHQHQRRDRDNYLSNNNCTRKPKTLSPFYYEVKGIYDYASQMHYQCNSADVCLLGGWPTESNVQKCGSDTNQGLSVLDVDSINSIYNCQGCYRHRWLTVEELTKKKANLYSFGFETRYGSFLIPCRGRILGSILAGKFNYRKNSCIIAHNVTLHERRNNFEILTIPGGLSKQCSVYKLVDRKEATLKTTVPAGDWINDYDWRSFIAYASITAEDGVTEGSVGTVWVNVGWKGFQNNAEVSDSTKGVVTTEYLVLTCSLDTACILKKLVFLVR